MILLPNHLLQLGRALRLVFVAAFVALAPVGSASAYSSVAFSKSLAYGYCFNNATPEQADSCALGYCRDNAGDPDTCAVRYRSEEASGEFSLATRQGRWGVGYAPQSAAADQAALKYCGAGCTVVARWSETTGMPDMATLPPLRLADPARTVVLITTHGSSPEEVPDPCHLDRVNVSQGMSSAIHDLDGTTIDGLAIAVDPFCTPHKLGAAGTIKVELREADLLARVAAYATQGVPARHLFIVGHSAGAWAGLLLKMNHPDAINAVIAASPAFAGEVATRKQWWWDRREAYLDQMAAASDLSALVFSFANESFEPPEGLGKLAHARNVRFIAVTQSQLTQAHCPAWTHATFLSSCFEPKWGSMIADYLRSRLK